ncbi:PAS domain S-box protein, partial [Corallococcus sp. 4LFB]|uniref:PAS domain S-box protein n=1 Tax=Corallococcus sp. 4LFB TaxID=3383249 RepID=UPI003974EB99
MQSEGWRVRKDGSRFWAETLLTALYAEGGTLQGFAEVTRDITERKRTERMQALLAEAGRVLQPQAGAKELGNALTRLCVPEVADACV